MVLRQHDPMVLEETVVSLARPPAAEQTALWVWAPQMHWRTRRCVEVTKPTPQDTFWEPRTCILQLTTDSIPQIKGLNIGDTLNTLDHAAAGKAKDGTVSVSGTLADELVDDCGDATLWMHRVPRWRTPSSKRETTNPEIK